MMRRLRSMDEALDRAQALADDSGYTYTACKLPRGRFTVTVGTPQAGFAKEWIAVGARAVFPEVEDEHVIVARYTPSTGVVHVPLRGADLDRRVAQLPVPTP